jgi:biopolymer transport protein ExbD
MRRLSHAHAGAESHGIDLAPMLDFVVNLLIFFIITAVFVKQAGVEVNRPSTVESTTDPTSKSIVIDEHGGISVDSKAIDLRAVRAHIEQFRATGAGGIVVVADRGAPTGAVVAVADQIRLGGIRDITFTTTILAKKP